MAMNKYQMRDEETGDLVIHYEGSVKGYTLCGDALKKVFCAGSGESVPTICRVNCSRCMSVVRHVRGR